MGLAFQEKLGFLPANHKGKSFPSLDSEASYSFFRSSWFTDVTAWLLCLLATPLNGQGDTLSPIQIIFRATGVNAGGTRFKKASKISGSPMVYENLPVDKSRRRAAKPDELRAGREVVRQVVFDLAGKRRLPFKGSINGYFRVCPWDAPLIRPCLRDQAPILLFSPYQYGHSSSNLNSAKSS